MNDFSVLLSLFESSADSRCTCDTRDYDMLVNDEDKGETLGDRLRARV